MHLGKVKYLCNTTVSKGQVMFGTILVLTKKRPGATTNRNVFFQGLDNLGIYLWEPDQ